MIDKGTKIDCYTIEHPISTIGGTASVYLGHVTESPKLKVAIKVANSESGQPTPEDILLCREADLLSRWDWRHSGIVRLYPVNKKDYVIKALNIKNNPWFMVMEYLRGKSLADNLSKIKEFPVEWKIELFYQILLGVSFLHLKGYAHRDLKLDNIVLKYPINQNDTPQAVLIDFALAWNGNDDIEYVKTSYTLAYASPERILHNMGYDYQGPIWAADIWSLGIIFYEIMTGQPLLKGSAEHIRTSIIESRLRIDLPEDDPKNKIIADMIREMVHTNPLDRPSIDLLIRLLEVRFPPPRVLPAN